MNTRVGQPDFSDFQIRRTDATGNTTQVGGDDAQPQADILSQLLPGLLGGARTDGAQSAQPAHKSQSFQGFTSSTNSSVDQYGNVREIQASPSQNLSSDAQDELAQNGLYHASKSSILVESNSSNSTDGTKVTAAEKFTSKLRTNGIIQDGKVDYDVAQKVYEAQRENTENNMSTDGLKKVLAASDSTGKTVLSEKNYKDFGLDTGWIGNGLSSKGKQQLEQLQKQGIVNEKGVIQANLTTRQKEFLNNQIDQNNFRDDVKAVADKKAGVSVKTGTAGGKDNYSAAKLDDNGNIIGADSAKPGLKLDHDDKAKTAGKQLQIAGLDDDVLGKMTTVAKDGSVTLDLSKLSPEEYQKVAGENGGINYSGSAALTIKDNTGKPIKVNIADGGTNNLVLEGNAAAAVTTANKELRIKSDRTSSVESIKGGNLRTLNLDGGTLKDGNLTQLNNLQGASFNGTDLADGLKTDSDRSLAIGMNDVRSAKDVSITSKGSVDTRFLNSKINGNYSAKAKNNSATTFDGVAVSGNIDVNAGGSAYVHTAESDPEHNPMSASSLKVASGKKSKIGIDGGAFGSTNLTGLSKGSSAWVAEGSRLGKLSTGDSNKPTFHAENQEVAEDLTAAGHKADVMDKEEAANSGYFRPNSEPQAATSEEKPKGPSFWQTLNLAGWATAQGLQPLAATNMYRTTTPTVTYTNGVAQTTTPTTTQPEFIPASFGPLNTPPGLQAARASRKNLYLPG